MVGFQEVEIYKNYIRLKISLEVFRRFWKNQYSQNFVNTYNGTMSFTDLLFPKHCLGCGYFGAYICLKCQRLLRYLERSNCFYCKKASLYDLTHPSCLKKFNISGVTAIFYYNPTLKKILKNIKYRLVTEAWKDLTKVIDPTAITKISFYKRIKRDFLNPVIMILIVLGNYPIWN